MTFQDCANPVVKRSEQSLLTCSHCTESFDLVVSDPFNVLVICRQRPERLFDHIGVHHQADILGDLRHEVCQVGSVMRTSCQHQAVRTEIFHVITYTIQSTSVAQCLDKGVCLGGRPPVHLHALGGKNRTK